MSITDELRKYVKTSCQNVVGNSRCSGMKKILAIADRIDERHEQTYHNLTDALHKQEEATYKLSEKSIMLPVDADGVPIHIGDVVYDCNESPSEKFSVAVMELNKWGWSLLDSYGERNEPGQCHHYRAPTVEDVLREFAERYLDYEGIPSAGRRGVGEALMDEYAAKLRLAEGVDA